jgi:hypothetical protein
MTTHLRLVPKLRIRGAIPPLPHTSSWSGAWLSTGSFLPSPYLLVFPVSYTEVPEIDTTLFIGIFLCLRSSFLGSTAQLRSWPPPQNPGEFLGGFSTIFFFTG